MLSKTAEVSFDFSYNSSAVSETSNDNVSESDSPNASYRSESSDTSKEGGSKAHLLPDSLKWGIIASKKLGMSNKQAALDLGKAYNRQGLHPSTIQRIWSRYLEVESVENKWNSNGRPKVVSEVEEEKLVEYCQQKRRHSVKQIKIELGLNAGRLTLNRYLLNNGYKSFRAPQQIKISKKNVQKRLTFSQEHYDWTGQYQIGNL